MPDHYDLLTARDEFADADMLDAVNLRVNHVDARLILAGDHELMWEVSSPAGLSDLERAAREIGLHLSKRTDHPVPVTRAADLGRRTWDALHAAGLVPDPVPARRYPPGSGDAAITFLSRYIP
jgi:hypothetical protein